MKCPRCKEKEMVLVFTEQGAGIDFCPDCKGICLHRGEIFYFTKRPQIFRKNLTRP